MSARCAFPRSTATRTTARETDLHGAYWYATGSHHMPLQPEIPPFEARILHAFGGLERWPGKDRHGLPY